MRCAISTISIHCRNALIYSISDQLNSSSLFHILAIVDCSWGLSIMWQQERKAVTHVPRNVASSMGSANTDVPMPSSTPWQPLGSNLWFTAGESACWPWKIKAVTTKTVPGGTPEENLGVYTTLIVGRKCLESDLLWIVNMSQIPNVVTCWALYKYIRIWYFQGFFLQVSEERCCMVTLACGVYFDFGLEMLLQLTSVNCEGCWICFKPHWMWLIHCWMSYMVKLKGHMALMVEFYALLNRMVVENIRRRR